LFNAKLYDGAYYLCGYSVECALKACIAKKTRKSSFPNKELAEQAYKHSLINLVKTAGLETLQKTAFKADPLLLDNWNVVKSWQVELRYEYGKSEQDARDMISACSARRHGVLSWLRKQW
jgi:hypothetical protein